MWSKKVGRAFVTGFVFLLLGCEAQGGGYKSMESEESSWNEKASAELVAFMSLEVMFTNDEVRSLAAAAGDGDLGKIEKIVARGVVVNSRGAGGGTPLFWSMKNIKGFEKLLELGADPNLVFDDGGTVMHWAAKKDTQDFLEIALKNNGNPNLVAGSAKVTPLFEAISIFGDIGNTPALTVLINAGANVDARTNSGDTPVIVAAGLGRFDVVYELLERGADYDIKNNAGDDLASLIDIKRKALDHDHQLYEWLLKVESWIDRH